MRRSVAVFDFDKTLTDKDTLFGFYRTIAGGNRLFPLKRGLLVAAAVLYKVGLINNRTLKRFGIYLFLKGRTRNELELAARSYSQQIRLNDVYLNHYQKTDGEKWIVSASPEIYLRHLFPAEHLAGTTFAFDGDEVTGLATNMFGQEKKKFLEQKGITQIRELYTDSIIDDVSLIAMSENVFIVSRGQILRSERPCKSGVQESSP
jgi:phosphoserine phosphatase